MAGFTKLAARAVKKPIAQAATELFDAGTAEVNKREEQHRDKQMFHISSTGYCMKSVYLDRIHGKDQDLSFLRKVNYGTKIHELYQKYLAASGKLFGMYYCKSCGVIRGPHYGGVCEDCEKAGPMEYSEIHLINSKLKVSGHPDGFLNINGKIVLTEIKTITGYSKIAGGPQVVDVKVPEHKHQTNFYLHVLQHPSTDRKSTRLNSSHRSLSRMPSSA